MGRQFLSALIVVLLCSSFALADRQWTEIQSPHFTVLTDTGEKQGREVAIRFEQMRAVFGSLFHKTRVNIPVPLQIIAFRNQGEFKNYVPLWKGKPVSLAGFYQGAEDRNFIALDMSSNDPYQVVFHEYAHLLLHGNFPMMPAWFDEGFAEYFSSLRVTGKEVEYGNVPPSAPYILQSTRWVPLADLFSVQHDSAMYNERDKQTIFYAQSWIVVHYLMSNQKMPETAKYLQLSQIEHVPVAVAVKQAFGVEVPVLEKAVHDYFSGNGGKYFKAGAPDYESGPFVAKHVDELTADATLADLHAHSLDHQQQAITEFQAVLEKQSSNFTANRGLGYLYLRQGEYEKASQLFARASMEDSKDARLHYLNALLMNREAMKAGRPPEKPLLMRQELQTAIELDPTMADAYNLLAFALSVDGKFEPAMTAQKKAIELNPSFEIYQVNLAHIYLQWEKWDEAEAILTRLQTASDPAVRENAAQNLAALKGNREMVTQVNRQREMKRDEITAPQWQRHENDKPVTTDASDDQPKPDTRKVLYMYGRIESVDCSADPLAVLSVKTGPKTLKLRAENYKKLLVMGADSFSCDWHGKKVLVNYKPGGKSDGDIVTLELQEGK